ncbi:MAG: DUF5132 domain-containing protein [Chloroflexi bacterium]|nr:DUF5132 domain-containing protein [Chloroflexota bacterium]
MFEGLVEGMSSLGLGGWALAVGAAVVAGPTLARVARPALKGAIKGYMAMSERVRVAGEETREGLQDVMAEAKAEYQAASGPLA